ncbi:cryptochrome/photolyase family protein [Streptomyces silvisoli]|uniref:Deoxyribodipyrimidine photo-lyase n=1 Tax=Streptomyces silvisoli TaxID=3034235 RepID=A0ABT5ZE75_9ACTN|nr:deoxyribodipyrimidine photo-lyase [Streptomyces silvisoli]MDF3288138.1 deoxyribodipyrimidine photo-lyase [Streptomyces silvisoli]
MNVSVVLFTSDLRLHDHPPLRAALDSAREIVPLFVCDDGIIDIGFAVPNRRAFLADCLADLDAGLRRRGGRLVVRHGDVVAQVCDVVTQADADEVHMAAGVTRYAQRREERLREALESRGRHLYSHDSVVTAVAPGAVTPQSSDHFAVFTPYHRHWARQPLRDVLGAPRVVRVPDHVGSDEMPSRDDVPGVAERLPSGGETEARKRLTAWLRGELAQYARNQDDLAGDATSRLSAHLHFGTVSAVELVHRTRRVRGPGADAFERQLAWRDFHYQVLAARPQAATVDYRPRNDRWRSQDEAAQEITAWKEGRTGYPVIDAAMRQLRHEGWMHNRVRLLTASFLTKTLYVDWRVGARHFLRFLVDGDIANNQLNWQWVAGTGTDTRPNRIFNPLAQAKRYDPDGTYVRRWLPELAGLPGPSVHEPWRLPAHERAAYDYPEPVVDLSEGLARFKHFRGLG